MNYIAALERMAVRHGVGLRVVAHAGDGNLHPTFWVAKTDGESLVALNAALDESISAALAMAGRSRVSTE